jgi:GT2 family glycosyltransferase
MYLAAGRPVVLQDTGFGNALPTGEGLFPFGDVEGAAEAIASIEDDPARHRQAARDIAREYLSHEVVLGEMLDHLGLRRHRRSRPTRTSPTSGRIPRWAPLTVTSRRPLILNQKTVRAIRRRPIPAIRPDPGRPAASVVVPVRDNLVCTRLALESLLVNTSEPRYEVVIIDDGSAAETRQYLEVISARNRHVSLLRSDTSRGFARACNRGLKAATADILVLLNNDTVVPPSWLSGLCALVKDPDIGLAGPTTNRCGGPAQITTSYETYGQMLAFARERSGGDRGTIVELPVVEMFCAAMRRDVFESVGPLDERFEVGMFEDDDYSRRVREAGFRVVCAENLFVHHFGEASLGTLAADGSYGEIFHANRRRFEEKWGVTWKPHGRRHDPEYAALARRIEAAVCRHVPEGSILLVASRGDEGLVGFDGREAWHFPRLDNGAYAGHHPPGDDAAIAHLERLRTNGAEYLVLPATSLWWLDHYQTFRRHLERYPRVSDDLETAVIYRLTTPVDRAAGRVGAKP